MSRMRRASCCSTMRGSLTTMLPLSRSSPWIWQHQKEVLECSWACRAGSQVCLVCLKGDTYTSERHVSFGNKELHWLFIL